MVCVCILVPCGVRAVVKAKAAALTYYDDVIR